jgi:hypothetical protein
MTEPAPPDDPVELHATDWFDITGRGRVAAVDLRQVDGCPERINHWTEMPIQRFDRVRIDGREYEVRDVDYARALVSPPFIKPNVGLLVREIIPDGDPVDMSELSWGPRYGSEDMLRDMGLSPDSLVGFEKDGVIYTDTVANITRHEDPVRRAQVSIAKALEAIERLEQEGLHDA